MAKRIIFLVSTLLLISCATSHRRTRTKLKPGVYHPVAKGETLWRISKTYRVSLKKLQQVNRIEDPADIQVGDRIFIPGARRIRRVKTVSRQLATAKKRTLKKKPPPPKRKRAPPRSKRKKRKKKTGKTKASFIWPVKGTISSRFGYRKKGQRHDGIDISAKTGTPIYSAQSGKVIYADNRLRHFGNTIILKHAGDWFTVYAHNKKNLVKVGQRVKRGEKIALAGNSGRSAKSHLHFEIRVKEKSVDPLLYLPKR